ncbi:MAG: ligase [Proteobacteria bacterium]|nr:MAG: ligase [Pseudomonadota bacterium]
MAEGSLVRPPLHGRLCDAADALAAALAVSLPWSTSATSILIVLWLIALIPTLDVAAVRREVTSAAGGLPVLFWALGALGMLWADVSWSERLAGLSGFHKLLVLPLLLAQFRRSGRAHWALLGFLIATVVLLAVSWVLALTPGLTWRGPATPGVPVKDYILQSTIFAACAFALLGLLPELRRARRRLVLALGLVVAFLANILYVATARTTLVVMAVLLPLLGLRQFGWKGVLAAMLIGGVLVGAAWEASPYLRTRVTTAFDEARAPSDGNVSSSVGLRFEYWKKSVAFIEEAPVIGHGTGTIAMLFRRDVAFGANFWLLTDNPHNQLLATMLQLGLVGAAALIAMWIAHLALFCDRSLMAWLGLIVVIENVVGSFFNSSLFDFSHGWFYVIGVGVAGGNMLHAAAPASALRSKT